MAQSRFISSATFAIINHWCQTGKTGYGLEMCSFKHVIAYMDKGHAGPELAAALVDYGYTRDEIDAAKAAGKTARDIAREIVKHGYDDSSDDL